MKLYQRIRPTRKRKEIREAFREILPFYIPLMVSLIIILFFPWITLVLPNLLMK